MPAITRLTLTRFRNYRSARLDVDAGVIVLTGANGAGKTNLLEALSFLSPGRGLRRARLDEVEIADKSDRPGWAVAATLGTETGPLEIGTGRDVSTGKERRLVRIDGHPARSQTALSEHLSMVWLTPQMDRLFTEGASGRRRFLDRLVFGFDPGHAGRISRFEHALRERARLLRDGRFDPAWLDALEDQMATAGVAISAARREVSERLTAACALGSGPFPRAALTVAGDLDDELRQSPALPVEDRLRARLNRSRRADAESGSAAAGPHRSDLLVQFVKGDDLAIPAATCSTGEQKALLLAIVLANARLLAALPSGPPLLLLDEVAAHLDEFRRAALYQELAGLGGQAWLTGTDEAMFSPLTGGAAFFRVDGGRVLPTLA